MSGKIAEGFLDLVLASYDEKLPPDQMKELRNTFFAGAGWTLRVIYESYFDSDSIIALNKEIQDFEKQLVNDLKVEGRA